MNPKIRNLLGVVAVIAIALLIIWGASRLIGNGEKKIDTPLVQDTCSNVDCAKCCAKSEAGVCLDGCGCCECKKPAPKKYVVPKPSALQQCLAKCDVRGGACYTSDKKCAVCQASCRGTSVFVQKDVEKETVVKTKVIHEKDGTCTDCDTPDIQPNIPGKGQKPSNDTGGGCTSGSCGTGNDFQSDESGGGYEPPN